MSNTKLPVQHVTIRVPWHDSGWDGSVCAKPDENTSCQSLSRIGAEKDLLKEMPCAGKQICDLVQDQRPPCVGEKVRFMADSDIHRKVIHPYSYNPLYKHFAPTSFTEPGWSAACIPFRWMLRAEVEGFKDQIGLAQRFGLGWVPEREPKLGFLGSDTWIQDKENQLASLDTFFNALRPYESLCFFYAKKTPLSQEARRVIIGVGRVRSVGPYKEYNYKSDAPGIRCVLWERSVSHSIRPGFTDGFIFPYQQILEEAEKSDDLNPEEFVCFAPDEQFDAFSYGSEHLSHDGAISSLVACAALLKKLSGRFEGPWEQVLSWVDSQLNRLWEARGAFPGLGSALAAFGYEFGYQYGTLLGYEIAADLEASDSGESPWTIFDQVMEDPGNLSGLAASHIKPTFRNGWKALPQERKEFLELLSRFSLSEKQALRFWDYQKRDEAGIVTTDSELSANPWRFFENDRRSSDAVSFYVIDRGAFPDRAIAEKYPANKESFSDDPSDPRRIRAFVTQLLEEAAAQGHTILPSDWLIRRAREKEMQPPCPLGSAVLGMAQESFSPLIHKQKMANGEEGWQIDWLEEARSIISREVNRRVKGRRHEISVDWARLVDEIINFPLPQEDMERALEERARREKTAALRELFSARISILSGAAGTGKTTLLKALLSMPEVSEKGILLLAPTGKARVRMEQQTARRGEGKTIAQYLLNCGRYDYSTGRYFPNPVAQRNDGYATVVIDESSMLTEDQLAAIFDSLAQVERFILVGDPRQLPPIGAGRPFVDVINRLKPENREALFPRVSCCFAELTVPRRQQGGGIRDDVSLAGQFSGEQLDPGSDLIWSKITNADADGTVELVEWSDGKNLQSQLLERLVAELDLDSLNDEVGFEVSIGGERYKDLPMAFFTSKNVKNAGAAEKVSNWQILSPVHAQTHGVVAINRLIQDQFRQQVKKMADQEAYRRKVCKPFGSEGLLYGDKVINIKNSKKKESDVWPNENPPHFIANGDLGVIVGQYAGRNWRPKKRPWALKVEFAGQEGKQYEFRKWEFSDDGQTPLELAYALTVHKTQGSEFGITFVILPNPCWLLSRELLYTALTRQRNKTILFHQGPFNDLRKYTGDQNSQILQRVTNLFMDPCPVEVKIGNQSTFLEKGLIHKTERGDLVRSKSELVIADKLHSRGVDYAYEKELVLPDGKTFRPDFTIVDHAMGITWYWEHLGLLHVPHYKNRWDYKKAAYSTAGIETWKEGSNAENFLIETRDDEHGGLDGGMIARIIDQTVLG